MIIRYPLYAALVSYLASLKIHCTHASKEKPIIRYDREIKGSSNTSELFSLTTKLLNFVSPEQQGRIVCGENVDPPNRYSYMASLQAGGSHFCGASLIKPGWVLSAAHCSGWATNVQIGRYNLADSSETYEDFFVDFEIVHPDFDYFYLTNDVMLVKLKGTSSYEPIKLDDGSDSSITANEADVTVMGWGTTSFGGSMSYTLQEVVVDVVENSCCNKNILGYGGSVTDDMMCAARLHKDSCQGDSGGPLIHRGEDGVSSDVLVGIVSWGRGCADRFFPGVYSRVSYLYDWIEENQETESPTISASPSAAPTPCPSSANATLTVSVKTDQYPYENSWDLLTDDGIVVGSMSYEDADYFKLYEHFFCVESDQCFVFNFFDNYGDGIENGYYEISYGDFNIKSNGFAYSTTVNFCG